jgi:glutamyl-tRNA synthetase
MKAYTTRIAPSPSGMFHIGTARTAYFNWLAARASSGKFIVRIDDTNEAVNKPEYIDLIYEALAWLSLDYDITFKQSERLGRYKEVADKLLENGLAIRKDGAVALEKPFIPVNGQWQDRIIGVVSTSMQDWNDCHGTIIVRSDGKPICCELGHSRPGSRLQYIASDRHLSGD